jgi:hypothetical protein
MKGRTPKDYFTDPARKKITPVGFQSTSGSIGALELQLPNAEAQRKGMFFSASPRLCVERLLLKRP